MLSPEKATGSAISAAGKDTDTSMQTWHSNELKLTEAKLVLPSATSAAIRKEEGTFPLAAVGGRLGMKQNHRRHTVHKRL